MSVNGNGAAVSSERYDMMALTDAGHMEASFEFLNLEQVALSSMSAITCEMNSLWRGDIVKGYEANTRTYVPVSSVEVAWESEAAQKSCARREASRVVASADLIGDRCDD